MSTRARAPTIFLICVLTAFHFVAMAQSEMPVIVRQPKVEPLKNFTNWQLIKVTYTIEYLDGYQVLLDRARPNMMNFSPFEIDSELGQEPIKINEYRHQGDPNSKGANYFDLVYYLRHIGEKKGDISLPEVIFEYVKAEPGKSLAGLEVKLAKAPGVVFRYDSTLTKNADDIIDDIDFGSFKKREIFWKYYISFSGFVISLTIALLLVFRRPSAKKLAVAVGGTIGDKPKVSNGALTPLETLKAFLKKLQTLNNRGELCNELRQLLIAYIPDALESDTLLEIKGKIVRLESNPAKESISLLANWLEYQEDLLYEDPMNVAVSATEIKNIGIIAEKLKPPKLFWLKIMARKDSAKDRMLAFFRKIKRLRCRP